MQENKATANKAPAVYFPHGWENQAQWEERFDPWYVWGTLRALQIYICVRDCLLKTGIMARRFKF